MPMGQESAVFPDRDFLLLIRKGKEIIIAADHMDHAGVIIDPFPKIILASLGITKMYQHIERSCLFNYCPQIPVSPVCITDDQNLHVIPLIPVSSAPSLHGELFHDD